MAIRLWDEDRAFFLNDLEGPVQKPILRITRRGVGGHKAYTDTPVSIVYYGAKSQPVATPGRNLTKEEEADFSLQSAHILPAIARKFLGVASNFQPFAGRITVTRDWQTGQWRK